MIEWLINNKEWVFSGLGIAVISAIFTFVKLKSPKSNKGNVSINGNGNIVGDGNVVRVIHPAEKQPSNIKIVDISVSDDEEFIVDIKLRNIGGQVAFIKEISFNILDYYNMVDPQRPQYQLVTSSNTYDVILGKGERQVYKVSQSIGADGIDRFQVKLASSIVEPRMAAIYYLSLSIIYDEDNKVAETGKYLWAVPSIRGYAGCYISHTNIEIAEKNYFALIRMNNYDAVKSKNFIGILESYEQNKSDFLD